MTKLQFQISFLLALRRRVNRETYHTKRKFIIYQFYTQTTKKMLESPAATSRQKILLLLILTALVLDIVFRLASTKHKSTSHAPLIMKSTSHAPLIMKSTSHAPLIMKSTSHVPLIMKSIRPAAGYNLTVREDVADLLTRLQFTTMIEVGVRYGRFARAVLARWPTFKHYYGVDIWRQQENYLDSSNQNDNATQERIYQNVKNRLGRLYGKQRITLIRNLSRDASRLFGPRSIDFVYLDARHDYCGASQDLRDYYPIVRCGGLMAGHDYAYALSGHGWVMCENGTQIEVCEIAYEKYYTDFYVFVFYVMISGKCETSGGRVCAEFVHQRGLYGHECEFHVVVLFQDLLACIYFLQVQIQQSTIDPREGSKETISLTRPS